MLPNGDYDFEVVKATEKTSSSGNDMIELQMRVWDAAGKPRMVFDNLVAVETMEWKTRHFAECCGLLETYEAGSMTVEDCLDRAGRLSLDTQKERTEGDKTYKARNRVKDYLTIAAATVAKAVPKSFKAKDAGQKSATTAPVLDDDGAEIPF